MKVLCIGGTGLISSAITRALLARRHDVAHFNRGQTATEFPAVPQIQGDRRAFAAFEARVQAGPDWDCVIDMVCFLPEEARSVARAFRHKTKQFILCSTVDVYARPQSTYPIPESADRGGVSAYGQAKVECEDILLGAAREGAFAVTIIRPVHTVNDRGRIHHSVGKADSRLFDRYRRGLPIIVHGDGSSLWTICHAEDAALAFAEAVGNPLADGKSYHLPGPETFTWSDFHRRAAAALGALEPRLVTIPTDVLHQLAPERAAITVENFQFNNCFDAALARRELGFEPRIGLEECIRRIYRHLESNQLVGRAETDSDYDRILSAWSERHSASVRAS